MKKNLLSFLAVVLFMLFAVSSTVNKIHYGAFVYNNLVEEKSDSGNYIEKNDGTKIFGKDISWKSGLLTKDQVKVDGQKFKITEIRGYRSGNQYFGRLKNEYIQRIIHGKINVYVRFVEETTTSTDHSGFSHSRTSTHAYQYSQIGEGADLVPMAGQEDIKKLVADCPESVEMISLSNSKIRKAIKKDPDYLNEIFEIYNKGCK